MSELVLQNRQRVRALDLRRLRRIARALLEDILGLPSYELGVHFVAVPEMIRLNETFLEHAGSTDVITFDHSEKPFGDPPSSRSRRGHETHFNSGLGTRNSEFGVEQSLLTSAAACRKDAGPLGVTSCPPRCRPGPAAGPALHGEIFICLPEAVDQARRFGTTWQSEVVRYLVHGILHVRGHDDLDTASRRRMKREEDRLLRELTGRFRLSRLARRPSVRS